VLIVSKAHLSAMRAICEVAYPDEGCGALLGTIEGDRRTVREVVRLANAGETRRDWFEIDPLDIVKLERRARIENVSIVGYFHSHPDAPCRPSPRDLERAWPVYAYVIVTVNGGSAVEEACWTLDTGGRNFENESIQIVEEHN